VTCPSLRSLSVRCISSRMPVGIGGFRSSRGRHMEVDAAGDFGTEPAILSGCVSIAFPLCKTGWNRICISKQVWKFLPDSAPEIKAIRCDLILYICVNSNWFATRWQKYSTHFLASNKKNETKQTIHRTTQQFWKSARRATSWLVIRWHLPYKQGKKTE
jgi:hypothetical protein